jgi:hypothetical protein
MFLIQHYQAKWIFVLLCVTGWLLWVSPIAMANHRGSGGDAHSEVFDRHESAGHAIPGAPFQVYWGKSDLLVEDGTLTRTQADEIIQTVIDAFSRMVTHRDQYARFDEALTKGALKKIIIEPKVFNRDGKEFMFLVARTKRQGQVKLLINAWALKEKGLVNHPDQLIPVLVREFQWVVSKADTTKKHRAVLVTRDLTQAPIYTNSEIRNLSEVEREQALQALLRTYLITVDNFESLKEQPYYEIGLSAKVSSRQSDSTSKLYDIRVRSALQRIVREADFMKRTPRAVRSLLNGKIWNVAFVHIESRDWATRTRVLPKDKAVNVGEKEKVIQPAKVLINLHRKAVPDDPYYALTNGLPMGALSTNQLAQVIALEIEHQIIEKSMRGHVAADEESASQ